MKTVLWRYFVDFEKEEKWLNEQVAKGLALTHFSFGRYTFEDCEPGEYIYRLQLLDNPPTHPESQKYLSFLEEQGVEYVCPWMRWVYLRKKAADGSFELYTDISSRLTHYKGIASLFLTLAAAEALIGLMNIFTAMLNLYNMVPLRMTNVTIGIVCLLISAAIIIVISPILRKIKYLKQEKNLRE